MWFNSWHGLLRVLVVGVIAYAGLVIFLRISGKRTLSKLNAFDLVVTVALGSMLATVILSRDVALLEGMLGFALLIALQLVVTWLSVRSKRVDAIIKSEPTLLCYQGQFLHEAMRRERVTRGEVLEAVRRQGLPSMEEVEAVVLESGATLTVIRRTPGRSVSVLDNVQKIGTSGDEP